MGRILNLFSNLGERTSQVLPNFYKYAIMFHVLYEDGKETVKPFPPRLKANVT